MPEWKQELANIISSFYLKCPIHIAKEIARVDKLYWSGDMSMDEFTESEKVLIDFATRKRKDSSRIVELDYFLDLGCQPHYNQKQMTK
jgi:hypothetical protein